VATPRTILNRPYRRARLASYAGLATLVAVGAIILVLGKPAAYAASRSYPYLFAVLGMGGLAAFMGALARAQFVIRCPACKMRLQFLLQGNWRLHIDPRVRCCPYCTQDLDAELLRADGTPAVGK
jgi:hypothetical protein